MTKTKTTTKFDIVIVLLAMSALVFFLFFNVLVNRLNAYTYPKMEDSIEEVESLIGEYSEYYVSIDESRNIIPHTIYSICIDDDLILFVPSNISNTVVVDVYTCWDALLGSYTCDFSGDNEYMVKGKHIKMVKSDLSFVFIDVNNGALKRVNDSYREDDNTKVKASVSVTSICGDVISRSEGVIEPRGSATWNLYQKMPYNLKLTSKKNMFGLGDYKKYCLLANATDKTLLKNEVFFDLANAIHMENTPKITNVNMFFNGNYEGVYSISTKVKDKKIPSYLSSDDFLLCWGAPRATQRVYYNCDFWTDDTDAAGNEDTAYVSIEWPDKGLVSQNTVNKVQEIVQNYVDIMENRKEGKLSDCVDLESLAKYYWIREIGMDSDGWYRSTYTYYKHDTGKLYYGPLWDMEYVLGATVTKNNITFTDPKGWIIRNNAYFVPLFKNQEFVDEVNRVYYVYDIEDKMYDSYNNFVNKSKWLTLEGETNYKIWFDERTFYDLVTVEHASNYTDYCKLKTDFYKERIDWIAEEMRKSKNN